VLLVDDSPSVRAVLRRFLSRTDDLEVVGEAADGAQAVAAVFAQHPEVVVMDLLMPVMDGYTAIERIMAERPTPIIVLSSRANRDQVRTAFEAIRRGAVDVLPKPEHTAGWESFGDSLPQMIRAVASAQPRPPLAADRPRRAAELAAVHTDLRWVVIGASTGGPAALREFFAEIPPQPPVTFLVVQHIAPGFEIGLAEWLNKELDMDVRLAVDGETPAAGCVRFAPGGAHLRVEAAGVLRIDPNSPARRGHRPSVDELFLSCVELEPRRVAAVLLTGMGADGVEGLQALRAAGALTLVQDEASSVVFGMPRVALERGAATVALSPPALARSLAQLWWKEPR
jgi:two-component system chemotaxis response regulator CheB